MENHALATGHFGWLSGRGNLSYPRCRWKSAEPAGRRENPSLSHVRRGRIGAARPGGRPLAPMGRPHVQPFLGFHFHPAVEDAPAREHERVRTVIVDDGQLEVAVERRAGYLLPHCVNLKAAATGALTYIMSGALTATASLARRREPGAPPGRNEFDLDQIRDAVAGYSLLQRSRLQEWQLKQSPSPPIRPCPVCGVAMQASKSRKELADFDTYQCLSCQTVIRELKPQEGG